MVHQFKSGAYGKGNHESGHSINGPAYPDTPDPTTWPTETSHQIISGEEYGADIEAAHLQFGRGTSASYGLSKMDVSGGSIKIELPSAKPSGR